MVAVGPHPSSLDGAAHAVGDIAVATPHTGAETVKGVVGDSQGFGFILESGHGQYRSKNLFLEDAHLVVAFEQGRLHVITAIQFAADIGLGAADQHISAFLLAKIKVGQDLSKLLLRSLGTNHSIGIQRIALLDRLDASQAAFHEFVVDGFLDQGARGAGAYFALVEREQHQAFNGLVEEAVVSRHHVFEKDIG